MELCRKNTQPDSRGCGIVIAVGKDQDAHKVLVRFPDLVSWWISTKYLKLNKERPIVEEPDKAIKGIQREHFYAIRANMKARKITGAQIAREPSRNASQINDILRGNYPWYQAYQLPHYLHVYLVWNHLLVVNSEPVAAGG